MADDLSASYAKLEQRVEERTRELAQAVETPVIASGGVKEVADIERLNPIGVDGVVVGRSLYEGTLTLKDALAAAR